MPHAFPIVAVLLAALSVSVPGYGRRYHCADPLVEAGTPFRRTAVLVELVSTTFYDRDGRAFWFGSPQPDGRLDLTVRHSAIGTVSEADGSPHAWAPRPFRGFTLMPDGSLDASDAHVDYGRYGNRGFLTALFTFFRDRLPVGASFFVIDISATSSVGERLRRLEEDKLVAFASEGDGAKLWAMYRRIRAELAPHEQLGEGIDPAALPAFRNYLADVGTIWGRIARQGDFRRDYLGPIALPYFTSFRKIPLTDATREAEDALLQDVELCGALERLLPRTRYEEFRAWCAARP